MEIHKQHRRGEKRKRIQWGLKAVVKYLWRGASQPFCKELGFVRRRDHPCLNMSARLAKLLRLVSETLPRSCTALARHETTPLSPSPFLPHPSCKVAPSDTALAGSLLFYLLPPSGFIYIALYSYPNGGYFSLFPWKNTESGWLGEGSGGSCLCEGTWLWNRETFIMHSREIRYDKTKEGAPLASPTHPSFIFCH